MSISKQLATAIRNVARFDAFDYASVAKQIVVLAKADQGEARNVYLVAFIGKRLGDKGAAAVITMAEHGRQPKAGQAVRTEAQQAAFGAAKTAFSRLLAKAEVKSTGKNAGNKARTKGKATQEAQVRAELIAKFGKAAAKVAAPVKTTTELHAKFEAARAGLLAFLNANAKLKGIAPYRAILADFGKALDTIPADGE